MITLGQNITVSQCYVIRLTVKCVLLNVWVKKKLTQHLEHSNHVQYVRLNQWFPNVLNAWHPYLVFFKCVHKYINM